MGLFDTQPRNRGIGCPHNHSGRGIERAGARDETLPRLDDVGRGDEEDEEKPDVREDRRGGRDVEDGLKGHGTGNGKGNGK